jgi:hypothetical protein
MSLFEKLTKSKFLSNVTVELRRAAQIVRETTPNIVYQPALHNFSKEESKILYYEICEAYDFFTIFDEMDVAIKQVYYIQDDQFLFVACRSKANIEDALHYSMQLNGDIPLYRHKHKVNGKIIYTILIDTSFTITPPSYN